MKKIKCQDTFMFFRVVWVPSRWERKEGGWTKTNRPPFKMLHALPHYEVCAMTNQTHWWIVVFGHQNKPHTPLVCGG
jgi:hypothetical protein